MTLRLRGGGLIVAVAEGVGRRGTALGRRHTGVRGGRRGNASAVKWAWAVRGEKSLVSNDFGGEPAPRKEERPGGTLGGRLLFRQPVLALLLAIILLTQAISGLTDLSFQGVLQDAIPNADAQTAFSGSFFMWLNVGAAGMQFVLTPLLLRVLPLRAIHIAIPLVHVATCVYLWRHATLLAAGTAYMAFKVLDYSLFRAAKELLYIPLSFDARYRAKELIDVLGYRLGKGGMSLVIVGLQNTRLAIGEPVLALCAASAAVVWAGLATVLPAPGRRGDVIR